MEGPIDDLLIERYLRRPETLSAGERGAVAAMLRRDAAAQEIAEELRAFYAVFEAMEEGVPDQVEAFLDTLFPPARIIALRPYRAPAPAGVQGQTVLAAMTPGAPRRFETVATLAAPEEQVLVRVLCDRVRRRCRLYALAEVPEQCAHALVDFPVPGVTFVTDEVGRVDLPLEAVEGIDWEAAHAVLRLPSLRCRLTAQQLSDGAAQAGQSGEEGKEGACRARFTHTGGRLWIEASGEDPQPVYAVIEAGEGPTLLTLQQGKGTATLPELPEAFTVRFY